jgi:nickel-dependent lactate racemase
VIVKLPYADGHLAVDLRGLKVRSLAPSAPSAASDPARLVAEAVDLPLAGPTLTNLAGGVGSATIVVPDATRSAALPQVLPPVFARLREGGVAARRTTVLVACGTHPAAGPKRLGEIVGPLPEGVSLVEHDSRDDTSLVAVGELRPGLKFRLHRSAAACDLLITVGTVSHHYFAGFGGGPKMVFPGVAGHAEIQANHALVLESTSGDSWRRHPACGPGCLEGNPVAEEIARAAELCPPAMAICLVPGRDGGVAGASAGPWRQAFDAAVARVRAGFEVAAGEPLELMVASAGGGPSDATLIQAHKALDAACSFLAPGGELLFLAALDRGAGSEAMVPFLDDPRPGTILGQLAEGWVQYGHTTLRLVEKTERFRVRLCSGLEEGLARRLGFDPAPDPEAVAEEWRSLRPGARVGVMASRAVYPRPT